MDELHEFYERYIAVFNARDAEAFAACFHPPVTVMRADRRQDRPDDGPHDTPYSVLEDPGGLVLRMPAHWSHSTIDAITTLEDALPFAVATGLPPPRGRRLGIIAVASRWDHEGRRYEQAHALYLLARRDDRLGIEFLAELGFTRLRRDPPA